MRTLPRCLLWASPLVCATLLGACKCKCACNCVADTRPRGRSQQEEEVPEKEPEPDFGLSGTLAAETNKVK